MNLPGTEIHLVTFITLVLEIILFFFQLFYCFQRVQEKSRLWYLLLLGFLIQYNAITGFLPDKQIPVSIFAQNIIAYSSSIFMSIYFAYYFYKVFDLPHIKRFATRGAIYFLLIPFLFGFCVPYFITQNVHLANKLLVIVPFFYAIGFLYTLHKSFKKKYDLIPENERDEFLKEKMSYAFIAATFWSSLPIVAFFESPQEIECIVTNSGFLIMSISYFRFSILQSRKEYKEYEKLKIIYEASIKEQYPDNGPDLSRFPLSEREKEIVLLVAEGKPYKIIADELNISYYTVKKHVSNIYEKLEVGNKIELIKIVTSLDNSSLDQSTAQSL